MRLLTFDSSGDLRSAALAVAGTVVAERAEAGARGHAERLVPLLDELLAEAGWAWSSLDRLAVAIGPGSFTGVRVAVATARALALALDRPVQPVTTLAALAVAGGGGPAPVIPTLDARRGGLYVPWPLDDPHGRARALPPATAAAAAPAAFTAVGSGAAALVDAAGRGRALDRRVEARLVAAAAAAAIGGGAAGVPGAAVRPLYVRAADAVPQAA